MPSTTLVSIRADTAAAIVSLLTAAATGVQVVDGPPSNPEREYIYVGDINGAQDHHDIRPGRKRRDDKFTVSVWFVAGQVGQTAAQNRARVQVLYNFLDDLLATDWTLGAVAGLKSAVIGTIDGPSVWPTDEGFGAIMRAEVGCDSLLQ